MTNNFNKIKDYIEKVDPTFDENADTYFVVELIRRGKDNPGLSAANLHFKNYYINRMSDLDKYKDEIIFLCDSMRMRAYFSVCCKSYEQVAKEVVAEMARRVANNDYKKPYAVFESCSGKNHVYKMWVVDIDKEDGDINNLFFLYKGFIESCEPFKPIVFSVPTRSGYHIICEPFNVQRFNEKCVESGLILHSDKDRQIIKKNHLTLLYENL